jgi:predicted nucleic acid-binding protein
MSFWDGMLVTAALDADCTLSQDTRDGARFGDLEILNPLGARGPSQRLKALAA